MTPELTPKRPETDHPRVRLIMVITMRNGVQIRAGVKDADIRHNGFSGELKEVTWTLDDDPYGSSIGWVDVNEVVAVHYEREPGGQARLEAPR